MKNLDKFYINGSWVKPQSTDLFPIKNPANEEVLGHIVLGTESDVNIAVLAANRAFKGFSETSKLERLDLLKRLRSITESRISELAEAMSLEMGAPITMAREAQADAALGHLDGFIEALSNMGSSEDLSNGDVIVKEPIGVCGLITPWNWPINQITLKVLPALATGCTCVLKPSEHTPLSALLYSEFIHEAGYPAGVFNLVNGTGPTVGSALSKHPLVQMVSFTGSTRAGKEVTKDAAETIKRVTLELGGKSANIIFEDCDLEPSIKQSVEECMLNTGQSCDAPTRLLVQKGVYDRALSFLKKFGSETKVGMPSLEGDHIGPLFDEIQYTRVQNLIKVGIDEGAEVLVGGLGKPAGFDKGWYVRPTIFTNVSNQMRIAQEEIFGPVLVVIPFDTQEEAIDIANDSPYGLAAYLYSQNTKRCADVAAKLKAGAIHINGGAFNYGSPFGGYKQSGNGREGGLLGLEDYLETKTLHWG